MHDVTLTLGDINFYEFEIPASISIEKRQELSVHRLMSGAQIVDVLGRGRETVEWKGVFSGADSSGRVCELDRLRLSGAPLVLSWDIYSYSVIMDSFSVEYCNPYWIPYTISCLLLQDLSAPVLDSVPAAIDVVESDISTANLFVNVQKFQLSVAVNVISPGSASYAAALNAGISTQADINDQLTAAGSLLSGGFLSSLTACQNMAQISAARGYISRAVLNLSEVEL